MSATEALSLPELLILEWPIALMVVLCGIASAVLYIYDCVITFSAEVEEIWSTKISGASLLYLLNRYGVLLYEILFLVTVVPGIPVMVITTIGPPAIFSLRTFALWGKSWLVLAALVSINIARMAIILEMLVEQWSLPLLPQELQIGPYVCSPVPPKSPPNIGKLLLIECILFLVFDSMVFLLTCIKTLRFVIQVKRLKIKNTISFIFFRDGAMYYLFALILGVVQIGLVVFSNQPFGLAVLETLTSISGSINQVLVSVLANRLVLNLRHGAHYDVIASGGVIDSTVTGPGSMMFRSAQNLQSAGEENVFGERSLNTETEIV